MTSTRSKIYRYIKTRYILWSKWEYMPMQWANIPVFFCYLYYAWRSGSITFFKSANPGIPFGGAFGVSKNNMMKYIPAELLPKTVLSVKGESVEGLTSRLKEGHLEYPLIVKPDIGERGFFVKKISSAQGLDQYGTKIPCDMIIQEFIDLPYEYTLSFNSLPGQPESFAIVSICRKGFMEILGDGIHSGRALMAMNDRYYLQLDRFEKQGFTWLDEIILPGQTIHPEPIGNHNRGTAFYDVRHLITPALIDRYRSLCLSLDGIYIGRFDIKAASEADFLNGKIKIMELNGVFGEPVHVYDPGYSPWRAYKDLFRHWKTIYKISLMNKHTPHYSVGQGVHMLRSYFEHKKNLKLTERHT